LGCIHFLLTWVMFLLKVEPMCVES
jgi:hypothetical protein